MARKRRGNNEGSITKRSDGRWMARVTLGFVDGKYVRKSLYGRTREEATRKMREVQRSLDRGLPVQPSSPLLKTYLSEWLNQRKDSLAPRTHLNYERMINHHMIPTIGHVRIEKLTQRHVHQVFEACKKSGLSASSVETVRNVLRAALNDAMRQDLISRNVAALATPPKAPRFEGKALTRAEAMALLQAAESSPYELVYRIAISLGMRQGEILGLRWEDVNFAGGVLHVRRQLQRVQGAQVLSDLKTHKSRRDLPIPESLLPALRSHRTRQLEERLQAGGKWSGDWDLVFMTRRGTPLEPMAIRHDFHAVLEAAGLPRIRFHDLRHTAASFMAEQGVHLSAAQAILGHSNVNTTAQVYTHVQAESMRHAVAAVDDLFVVRKRVE